MPLTPNTNPTSPESANPETIIAEFQKLGGKFLAKGHRSTWSPDGKKIAFGKGPWPTGIVVLDLDSGRTTQTDSGKNPSWSGGDGRWIAYMTGDGDTQQVWVMEASGGNARRISDGGFPSWTADGKHLLFSSLPKLQLLRVEFDDAQIAFDPKPLAPFCDWYPAISPDGSRVAYRMDNVLVITESDSGKTVQRFALPPRNRFVGGLGGWSPDGKQLGFGGHGMEDTAPCLIVDVDTGQAVQVASGYFTLPAWSPDGSQISFDLRLTTGTQIWLLETARLRDLPTMQLGVP